MARRPSRRRPVSSPTRSRRKSSWRPATRPPPCCKRSPQARLSPPRRRGRVGKGVDVDHDLVLVIDNYDSFTYNLVQYLGELGERVIVRRNNEITLGEISELQPVAAV